MLNVRVHRLDRRRRGAGALALVVAAALLASCADDPAPQAANEPLALASVANSRSALAAESADAGPATGEITATTTLPAGPSSGPIYRPDTANVTTEGVGSLAQSLGLPVDAQEQPGGWVVPAGIDPSTPSPSEPRLVVLKDDVGSWFFGTTTACDLSTADGAAAGSCSTSSVAVAEPAPDQPSSSTSGPDGPGPSRTCSPEDEQAAQSQATATLVALGAGDPTFPVDSTSCRVTVAARASIEGQGVEGLVTSVSSLAAASGPSLIEASGTLAAWTRDGEPLPLVDATTGLARVNALPQPAIAELCRPASNGEGCLTSRRTADAATPGLMRDTDLATNRAVVVPAWTFTVRTTVLEPDGSPAPDDQQPSGTSTVTVTALADVVLATVAPATGGEPSSDDGSGGGSAPGSPGVDGGDPVAPPAGVDIEPAPATQLPLPVDVPEPRGTTSAEPAAP